MRYDLAVFEPKASSAGAAGVCVFFFLSSSVCLTRSK